MLLLQKSGDEWIVPATSLLRFDSAAVAIGQTPLSDILSEDEGEITLDADHANIGTVNFDTATITTLNNVHFIGSKGTIENGVANKAVAISDVNGNLRQTDSTHAIYLDAHGVPTEITGSISNNTTGKANTAGTADEAIKMQTARSVQTKLDSTSAVNFDGTSDIQPGVTGILAVPNGGTGQDDLNKVTVGVSNKLGTVDIGGTTVGTAYNVTKSVYLSKGTPLEGLTIYSSTSAPDPAYSDLGNTGDI